MAQIDKPNLHFNTVLYTGNGSAGRSITGVNFQPDMVWGKCRNNGSWHNILDAVRGVTKVIVPNESDAEATRANGLTAFGTDGFTVGTDGNFNGNNDTYVAWNWKANGAGSANTDGATNTTVSVNTTAGFSIVKWTGTGSATTLGHGLGAVPKCWIIKNLDQVEDWRVYHNSLGNTKILELNNTDAEASDISYWNNTSPTSSVMTVGSSNANNGSGRNMIAYCFAEKKGYSKFGKYAGNGNADGAFIYTGFKPAMTIHKRTDTAGSYWRIFDNKRSTSGKNVIDKRIFPQAAEAEDTAAAIDFCSNGFKMRGTSGAENASGGTYIYMAFAENPIVGSNNIPAIAR